VSLSQPGAPKRPGSPAPPGLTERVVRLITLGCGRNEVDSEELAARLESAGWTVTSAETSTAEGDDRASVVVVNTCGFIQAAKEDSIGVLLGEAQSGLPVVAAGCLAERYGAELASALPEAEVISFDDYASIAERLDAVLAGERKPAHTPRDRRRLLPLAPADRPGKPRTAAGGGGGGPYVPGHGSPAAPGLSSTSITAARSDAAGRADDLPAGTEPPAEGGPPSGPRVLRRRLSSGFAAPLKIASGCDRRCTFCAIPFFRGAFVSREPAGLLAEAAWLAADGVRELVLVSENSTSYGKDLGNLRLLEEVLPSLAAVAGIAWVRVSYLQPAEMRPGLATVIASTPGVAPYFDLSFQHASGPVLRSMRRFGDRERFTELVGQIRQLCPYAGIRSNFIVGFPGEARGDVEELKTFLEAARLDAIGIFGYSDEDGTAAASLPGKLGDEEIGARVRDVSELAEELMAQRAEERIGEDVTVLLETPLRGGGFEGRAAHQAPEVDGSTIVRGDVGARPGDLVRATVRASEGVDLVADALEIVSTAGTVPQGGLAPETGPPGAPGIPVVARAAGQH
jgi:ribosomal protein S12 methylthiotransferase